MTWHQWHQTASRSRMTKRFSALARANRSALHALQASRSSAIACGTNKLTSERASTILRIDAPPNSASWRELRRGKAPRFKRRVGLGNLWRRLDEPAREHDWPRRNPRRRAALGLDADSVCAVHHPVVHLAAA